jgi:hypothetical protein
MFARVWCRATGERYLSTILFEGVNTGSDEV